MRKELTVTGITLKCDGCGEYVELGDGAAFYEGDDGHLAEEEATESGWLVVGNRHFCPECWKRKDDGNIETKDGRLYDGETLKDITPWTPNLIHIKVEITRPLDFSGEAYEAVDLGLPSGRKWADRNVGQKVIDDSADYGYLMDFDSAQHIPLPKGWKVPSKEDFKELCDHCTHEWVDKDGLRGMRFTGKNGNSIFLPAAGYTWFDEEDHGTPLSDRGTYGFYWSSGFSSASYAYGLNFNSSSVYPQSDNNRRYGFTVRAVQ